MKTEKISVRMTEQEKQAIASLADKRYISVSALIRSVLLKELEQGGKE